MIWLDLIKSELKQFQGEKIYTPTYLSSNKHVSEFESKHNNSRMVIMVPYVPALGLIASCLTLTTAAPHSYGLESLGPIIRPSAMVSYSFRGEMVLFINACHKAGKYGPQVST